MMATRTPLPSVPPKAASRSTTPSGSARSRAARASVANGSLQAGSASRPGSSLGPPRSLAFRATDEDVEQVGQQRDLARVGGAQPADAVGEDP